jgi:hypothetical protein
MASYMPSFMSKNLSTGVEAAYGQPFAFTTRPKFGNNTPKNQRQRNPAKQPRNQKERTNANEKKQNNPRAAQIAEIVVAVTDAMEKKHTKHVTTSAHSSKKKDKRLKLDPENLLAFRTAKKDYLTKLTQITSINGADTYADYQNAKAKAYQLMMTTKIETLEKQAQVTYKTYESEKPSKAAEKMRKKIAHLTKDNNKLHMSKKGLDDEDDYAKFKNIMHAYYEAELDACDMSGKDKRVKPKEAKKAKSAALQTWDKTFKTDETKPDTRSEQEATSDALAEHWENNPQIPDNYKGR